MNIAGFFRTLAMHINRIAYPIGPKKITPINQYIYSSMVFNLPG